MLEKTIWRLKWDSKIASSYDGGHKMLIHIVKKCLIFLWFLSNEIRENCNGMEKFQIEYSIFKDGNINRLDIQLHSL